MWKSIGIALAALFGALAIFAFGYNPWEKRAKETLDTAEGDALQGVGDDLKEEEAKIHEETQEQLDSDLPGWIDDRLESSRRRRDGST